MAEAHANRDAALALLGLHSGASRAQITTAYRRLARASHPDRCADPGADERFAALTAAYRRAIEGIEDVEQRDASAARAVAVRRAGPKRRPAETAPLIAGPVRFVPWTWSDP